jgi:hypothetical protein
MNGGQPIPAGHRRGRIPPSRGQRPVLPAPSRRANPRPVRRPGQQAALPTLASCVCPPGRGERSPPRMTLAGMQSPGSRSTSSADAALARSQPQPPGRLHHARCRGHRLMRGTAPATAGTVEVLGNRQMGATAVYLPDDQGWRQFDDALMPMPVPGKAQADYTLPQSSPM